MSENDFKGLFPVIEREPRPFKLKLRLRLLEWLGKGRVVVLIKYPNQAGEERRYVLAFVRDGEVVCFKNRKTETGKLVLNSDGTVGSEYDHEWHKWVFLNKKWQFVAKL